MTVGDVIEALMHHELDVNVYVGDTRDGTAQIAQSVAILEHLEGIPGVKIPDDVCILPWADDEETPTS